MTRWLGSDVLLQRRTLALVLAAEFGEWTGGARLRAHFQVLAKLCREEFRGIQINQQINEPPRADILSCCNRWGTPMDSSCMHDSALRVARSASPSCSTRTPTGDACTPTRKRFRKVFFFCGDANKRTIAAFRLFCGKFGSS